MEDRKSYLSRILCCDDVAIRCCSREEVSELANIISELYPDYSRSFRSRADAFGRMRFTKEICFRFTDLGDGRLDHGHADSSYYRDCGRKIVNFADIFGIMDLGAFDTGFSSVSDALREILV